MVIYRCLNPKDNWQIIKLFLMHLNLIDYSDNFFKLWTITEDLLKGLVHSDIMDVRPVPDYPGTSMETILNGESIPKPLWQYLKSSSQFSFWYLLWEHLSKIGSDPKFASSKTMKIDQRYSLWMNLRFTNFKTVEYTQSLMNYKEMAEIGNP